MRFDDQNHLAEWRANKTFPRIHDAMAAATIANMTGSRVLDLGCSFGLLGARVFKENGLTTHAVGIEADEAVVRMAEVAGVPVDFYALTVSRETCDAVITIVAENRIDVVLARRVFPELFGDDLEFGREFVALLGGVGVKELFIEGRVPTPRATNALSSIDQEVELVSGYFREVKRTGAVSYQRVF